MPYLVKYYPWTTRFYIALFGADIVTRHGWKLFAVLYFRELKKS